MFITYPRFDTIAGSRETLKAEAVLANCDDARIDPVTDRQGARFRTSSIPDILAYFSRSLP